MPPAVSRTAAVPDLALFMGFGSVPAGSTRAVKASAHFRDQLVKPFQRSKSALGGDFQ